MKKNELVTLSIEDLTEEGLGVGRADGLAVFVKDTVPLDRVTASIVKVKKNYAFGRALEILEKSPDRTEALCPVSRACGGCQIQEMRYDAQLRFKERKVRNNLSRIGGFQVRSKETSPTEEALSVLPILGMEDPWHYRNKAQFPVGMDKSGKIVAGFYAGRTHSIIQTDDCAIGISENEPVMRALLSYMKEEHVSPYEEGSGEGLIRHVMIRCGFQTGQIMVVIVANAFSLPSEERLISRLRELTFEGEKGEAKEKTARRRIVSVILNTNTERTNVILGKKNRVLFGEETIEERIGNLRFHISPLSFFQVNPVQTKVLYDTVLSFAALSGEETVWDLYCHIGTISLCLANQARKVYGIEVIEEAVEDARKNAALNRIDHAVFLAGKAEELFPELVNAGEKADATIVDPPRKGLEASLIDAILRVGPERIDYRAATARPLPGT